MYLPRQLVQFVLLDSRLSNEGKGKLVCVFVYESGVGVKVLYMVEFLNQSVDGGVIQAKGYQLAVQGGVLVDMRISHLSRKLFYEGHDLYK